ncbi:cytochrome c [candidate division KSB1 bacterium]|nr:cytochrome c [candidate division KSB1 bacterium]
MKTSEALVQKDQKRSRKDAKAQRFAEKSLAGSLRLCVFACVSFLGCEAKPPEHVTDPGHLIYLGFGSNREVQCSRCHGEEGTGGMFGPKLRGIVQRKGADHVRETILHGVVEEGEEEMPPFAQQLSEEEIEQVIRFVTTLTDSVAQ